MITISNPLGPTTCLTIYPTINNKRYPFLKPFACFRILKENVKAKAIV